jgi:hypothetical protein
MAAVEPFCTLIGIDHRKISKAEFIVLEAELFLCICNFLKEYFRVQFSYYDRIMNFTLMMEEEMLETNFAKLILNDILLTNEYTIEGIANYTGIHSDIIHDVITGVNVNPSVQVVKRAIDLHRKVRNELYQGIMKQLLDKYSQASLK